MEAADALLRHLPDDPGLLAVALTGAAACKNVRAQARFAARIVARGEARPADRETLLRLLAQIVQERTETLLRVLPPLRLLLGEEAWPQVLEIVLQSLTDFVCGVLDLGGHEADLKDIRRELDLHRATLAGRPEFEALEAALDCLRPDGAGAQALKKFLERTPDLAAALTALRVLRVASSPWSPPAVGKALEHAREAVLSSIDLRWRLWRPLLPALVLGASRSQTKGLIDRLRGLLRSEGLTDEDRQALLAALAGIADLQQLDKLFRREGSRGPRPAPERPPRKRRRKPEDEQLSFDLF
jgi:hypothetical protein